MQTKYMILGGNGVFGMHLTKYLLENEKHAQVFCVGRNYEKINAFSLHRGTDDERYSYHQIHIAFETDRLFELYEKVKPDYIINFAALAADVASSWKYSTRFYDTNTVCLARITDYLIGVKWLKKWVQIGSSEIFGSIPTPANEETRVNPTSPYAISKLAGDFHLRAICKTRDFPMNILWPSNGYGPGQQLYRIIPKTILACLLNRRLPLQGGGRAIKSFIHAQDLSHAIYLTIHNAEVGKYYNVGPKNGIGISIKDLVEKVAVKCDKNPHDVIELAPERLGEDASYLLDSSKIKTELGWEQRITLDEGIEDTIHWVKKYLNELKPLSTDVFFQG